MKHNVLRSITAAILAAAFAAPGVHAQSNDSEMTLRVSATISNKCRIDNGSRAIEWTIDPAGSGVSTSPNTTISFRCTKDAPFGIKLDGKAAFSIADRKLKRSKGGEMGYTLARDVPSTSAGVASAGLGFGANRNIDVVLRAYVAEAQYQDAPSGTYSDDVTVVIEP